MTARNERKTHPDTLIDRLGYVRRAQNGKPGFPEDEPRSGSPRQCNLSKDPSTWFSRMRYQGFVSQYRISNHPIPVASINLFARLRARCTLST
jgi:hypothetical protein